MLQEKSNNVALLTRTSDMLISLKRSDPDVLNAVYVSVNTIQLICISAASEAFDRLTLTDCRYFQQSKLGARGRCISCAPQNCRSWFDARRGGPWRLKRGGALRGNQKCSGTHRSATSRPIFLFSFYLFFINWFTTELCKIYTSN